MSAIDTMRSLGRPIAYHPALARHVGGVNAAILLCQLIYWDDKAEDADLGVYKTADEWEAETGLSYREQAGARKKLRDLGLLTETAQRLKHRIYYKLNHDVFDALINQNTGDEKADSRENPKAHFPNDENAIGEQPKAQLGDNPKRNSLIGTETTTETTTDIPPIAPSRFDEFWEAYPNFGRRVAKKKCLERWKANNLDSIADEIIDHVKAMRFTKGWKEGFEPAALTYLNQNRWEDGIPPDREPKPASNSADRNADWNARLAETISSSLGERQPEIIDMGVIDAAH